MDTDADRLLGRARLLQLVSPSLPIGGFTYSQGLEWAVEAGWVHDAAKVGDWLGGLLEDGMQRLELPVLARLHAACRAGDRGEFAHWARVLYAGRETRELRAEERNRARALLTLLRDLGVPQVNDWADSLLLCQAAPFACAAVHWGIGVEDCALGYAWGWLESQVAAAVKLVPLGQTDGQRLLLELGACLPAVVDAGLRLDDASIGAAAPALAIASARHETQYTRLFRS
jgi:urease accessory protein